MLKDLGTLKTGDAFEYEDKTYIALSLTEDPYEVYCLNIETKDIVSLEEATEVHLLSAWNGLNFKKRARRGKQLRIIGDYT